MPKKLRTWLYTSGRSSSFRIGLIVALFGLLVVWFSNWSFGFHSWNYDLSFKLPKPHETVTNAVLVYINDNSLKILGAEAGNKLSRTNYEKLIDTLNRENARLIFLDAIFKESNSATNVDLDLARAMHQRTNVFLVCDFVEQQESGGASQEASPNPPIPVLATAAVAWGHAEVFGDVIRTISEEWKSIPYAVRLAAKKLNPQAADLGTNQLQWLHYYGYPSNTLSSCTVQDVISNNFPRGFFDDKIVVIGQGFSSGAINDKMDIFATPYSSAPGAYIHSTALLNLTRGDWLREVPFTVQCLIAILWAIVSVALLRAFSGRARILQWIIGLLGIVALAVISGLVQWHWHWWWPWLGPALALTPLATLLSVRTPKPDPYIAFISYRTDEDGSTALLIEKCLAERGLKVFLDVNSLHAGKFDGQLLKEIDSATYFILLLSPNSLARCVNPDDWVLRELSHALAKGKTIIPVLRSGFRFDAEGIPDLPQITELKKFHGVAYATKDFDGFIHQLLELLTRPRVN